MKNMKQNKLALAIGAMVLGSSLMITTAHADPVASAAAVVSFENFTINWASTGAQVNWATDFTGAKSVNSSQLTAANMTGMTGVSMNPSSSTGADIVSTSVRGTIDPAITGIPGTTATTVFNVPTLPLVGNFSASASNETGAPLLNFPNSTSPVTANADLHNASYASLDSLNGTAGTSTSSVLASTVTFTSGISDFLEFNFDVGAYIGAFLSTGAAQSASASWSVSFNLKQLDCEQFVSCSGYFGTDIVGTFSASDDVSNNLPGTGTTVAGVRNSTLTAGIINLTPTSFTSLVALTAGNKYSLTSTISTRAQVERIPEPATLALLGIGLLGFGVMSRRTKK
jgi:hypothetical protein